MLFIIQYQPRRENFIATMTQDEGAAVMAHFEYLKILYEQKKARYIGRREDGKFGIAILDLESQSEASSITENDPVVKAGVFEASVGEFKPVMGSLV